MITLSPFWLVGLEALLPGGVRLHAPTIFGMLIGCIGTALLVSPGLGSSSLNRSVLYGFLILQLGMASWSYGSIYVRRQQISAHPIVVGAVQQLVAGLAALPLALLFDTRPAVWNFRGIAALLYLVTFGSIVGYSAYSVCARPASGCGALDLSLRELRGGRSAGLVVLPRTLRREREHRHGDYFFRRRARQVAQPEASVPVMEVEA